VAAVVKGKDTLLLKAYGKGDVEGDVPTTVDTVFPIGSDTKQFTFAAILQLRDQGKLSLDDDITKWLPDFETRGNKVTLRHLLGHTSGIVGLTEMPELRAMRLMRNSTATRDAVYKVISRYPFQFPTGTMQAYSNSGFWLLGLIIEKASAESLLDHFALLKGIAERRARKAVVEALLRQTNLWEVRKQKLGGYSGGMRQRFGVAVALLGNPKLMIVDELTAGLDPAERVRFLNLLSELGENSVVLLSTHIVEDVSELCN
jgi:ABC-type sugar transport system ATPase subunit